jgi:putative nucleotidyltransferase with HDIG domain
MTTFTNMPAKARAYWWLVVLTGVSSFLFTLRFWNFHRADPWRVLLFMLAATGASRLKIRLPGILVTLSVNYVVIMTALLNLNPGAGMIVGVASALGQSYIYTRQKPQWFQALFNAAAMSLPILAAESALRFRWLSVADPSGWLNLLAASMEYFFINTVIVAGIVSCTSSQAIFRNWRESYLWTFPQYLVGGGIAGAIHFLQRFIGWPAVILGVPAIYLVYLSYKIYMGRVEELRTGILERDRLHLRTMETLSLAIGAREHTTAAPLRRVRIYASEIGKELRLSDIEIQALEAAALLHDIGKLAVPENIVSGSGKSTPDEFEKMKVHPVAGAEILERVHFPYPVVPIVRAHHEKYDGSGYPDGLAGDRIPIGARILSAVDYLDELASDRPHRKAMPLEDAMQIVRNESGKSFDPRVVAVLEQRLGDLERKAKAENADCELPGEKVGRGLTPANGLA